jgi:aspartate kinase
MNFMENLPRTVVMKFGGASVARPSQFAHISEIILKKSEEYDRIAVVVSAMGSTTDELFKLAKEVSSKPPHRELDMLVSVGERISISLLAMALDLKGKEAISFTGSQSGIITCSGHTEARIVDVRPKRLLQAFEQGKIVIVAGFQGVSLEGEITTLGRGGSDTTAVALGVALQAEKVEFYKDVDGICNEDPKKNSKAKPFEFLSFEEALDITKKGAKVLHHRSIVLAAKNHLPLHVLPFNGEANGTVVGQISRKQLFSPLYETVRRTPADCHSF